MKYLCKQSWMPLKLHDYLESTMTSSSTFSSENSKQAMVSVYKTLLPYMKLVILKFYKKCNVYFSNLSANHEFKFINC